MALHRVSSIKVLVVIVLGRPHSVVTAQADSLKAAWHIFWFTWAIGNKQTQDTWKRMALCGRSSARHI